jgi:HAD superfamily hydrolase (TIGR01509 family)
MDWIYRYQLFLFDLDGLLVNTEPAHYQAYIRMCAMRGFQLEWTFSRYSKAAHHRATDLRDQIYAEFPALYAEEPNWSVLYEEKKQAFLSLINEGAAELMPGASELLLALDNAQIPRAVVTHSAKSLIDLIRKQNPILDTIPHWITRENYTSPKPHPECYLNAIKQLSKENDSIIGFEDSPRGILALQGTTAKPVLICPPTSPYLSQLLKENVLYYPSFTSINDENAP